MRQIKTCRGHVRTLVVTILACAAMPAGAETWGVKTKDPLSSPPSTLFRVVSGSVLAVGEIKLATVPIDVDGLAVLPGPTLRAFEVQGSPLGSRLIAIDPATAAATAIGALLPGRNIRGAAHGGGGRLLALDAATNELLEVDETTGAIIGSAMPLTLLGVPFDLGDGCDLVESAGGQWIVVGGNAFYSIDIGSGALTALHVDAALAPDGSAIFLAGLSWGDDLGGEMRLAGYDINGDEDLFTYDPTAGFARTLALGNILPVYNAGRGDLASPAVITTGVIPVPEAADGRMRIAAWPNPARHAETIALALPLDAWAEVTVHDASGRFLRKVAGGAYSAGSHVVRWDGRDQDGRSLSNGIYFLRLRSGMRSVSSRFAVVR